tara:strand:- start:4205 stop:4813 length:609 start_codon:yes stop_codon:yes gene_type:complete
MKNRVILTDVDGVLLNWEFAFKTWMIEHGAKLVENHKEHYRIGPRFDLTEPEIRTYVRFFNESATIGFLPPQRDAMYYVKRLHEEHGYVFHTITSLGTHENGTKLRIQNLEKLFGETVFEKHTFLELAADKDDALAVYKDTGCWWVEDKIINAQAGTKQGLNSILVEHGHNMHYTDDPDVHVVKNWKEIYNLVTKEDADRGE